MAVPEISDADIAALSLQERRELIGRLAAADATTVTVERIRRIRRRRLALNLIAAIVLIPWIVYLTMTLPDRYVARHWALAWVGFDVLLLAMFATTALLGLKRRQLLMLSAFGTGLLLLSDAWFDVTTAGPRDRALAFASAVFIEIPVAVLLISSALRLVRVTATRPCVMEPGQRLWAIPLPLGDLLADIARRA